VSFISINSEISFSFRRIVKHISDIKKDIAYKSGKLQVRLLSVVFAVLFVSLL
jgi:hypothetical protein